MNTPPTAGDFRVPIRRTRWTRFLVGAVTLIVSVLLTAALGGLLIWLKVKGAIGAFIALGFLWSALFLTASWQRRAARRLDQRRPGICLVDGVLTVPVTDDRTLEFNLDAPYELRYGWFQTMVSSSGGPTTNMRIVMTFAMLTQAGQTVLLQADESARAAMAAGWPRAAEAPRSEPSLRLWANDIIALVETLRTRPGPAVAMPRPTPPPEPGPAPSPEPRPAQSPVPSVPMTEHPAPLPIRDWPQNPLSARNRNELMLYLERQQAEVVSRSAFEGGEEVLGRTPESAKDARPYLYRFVFTLVEADPADENDFGSGLSRILDPVELMLEVGKLERDRSFNAYEILANNAAIALTYRPVGPIRRMNERAIALVDQAMRFAQADGWPSEEAFQTTTARKWFQLHREQYHVSALRARQQAFRENLKFLEFPVTGGPEAERQAALVQVMREHCPDYLAQLQTAGFESAQTLHPKFNHRYHVAVFAARAIQQGRVEQAQVAFAAWLIAQPNDLYFPTKEFAEAVYELKVDSHIAASLVPERQRNYFGHCFQEANPDNVTWGY